MQFAIPLLRRNKLADGTGLYQVPSSTLSEIAVALGRRAVAQGAPRKGIPQEVRHQDAEIPCVFAGRKPHGTGVENHQTCSG